MQIDQIIVAFGHVADDEALERIVLLESGSDGSFDFIVQLFNRTDDDFFGFVFSTPNRERNAPIARARQVPVVGVLEPVAETAFARGFRFPIDLVVQVEHAVAHVGDFDKPRIERIIQKRLVGTPRMRIAVDVFLDLERLVFFLEFDGDFHVNRFLGCGAGIIIFVLHIFTGEFAHMRREFSLQIHQRNRHAVFVQDQHRRHFGRRFLGDFGVVCTECRRGMHDSGAVFCRDKITRNHAEGVFGILVRQRVRKQLFVLDPNRVLAFEFRNDFEWNVLVARFEIAEIIVGFTRKITLAELFPDEVFRQHDIDRFKRVLVKSLDQHIIDFWPDGKRRI